MLKAPELIERNQPELLRIEVSHEASIFLVFNAPDNNTGFYNCRGRLNDRRRQG